MATSDEHTTLPLPEFTPPARILIVSAPYYRKVAEGLLAGARATIEAAGCSHDLIEVPGALEIPPAIRIAAQNQGYSGYVALGCIIRGETTHYDTVCNDSSRGLMMLGVDHGLCIGNGILTCETMDQAILRADPEQMNKGGGAVAAALHLAALKRKFRVQRGDQPVPEGEDFMLAGTGLSRTI
ncbi:MAG: 6,7-dimethyl-8-ribityllumazine synthase [Pseudomonadota bacterium]